MKTFGKKSLSETLYWLFVLCFIGLVILIFREMYVFAFTDNYYIENYFNLPISIISLSNFLPKAIFFYLLIMIFKSFKTDLIFTNKTLLYLNVFTVFSLCLPIVRALFNYFSLNTDVDPFLFYTETINSMIPELMLGVFAAYITAIFKRGLHLKTENDLTI